MIHIRAGDDVVTDKAVSPTAARYNAAPAVALMGGALQRLPMRAVVVAIAGQTTPINKITGISLTFCGSINDRLVVAFGPQRRMMRQRAAHQTLARGAPMQSDSLTISVLGMNATASGQFAIVALVAIFATVAALRLRK